MMGPFQDPKATIEAVSSPCPRKLPRCATDLLVRYFKYVSFWKAYTDTDNSKWAGRVVLNLEPSRSAEIAREIAECGSPWGWFANQTLDMIEDGLIPHGIETQVSDEADRFFMALVGGPGGARHVDIKAAPRARVRLKDVDNPAQQEAMGYILRNLSAWYKAKISPPETS